MYPFTLLPHEDNDAGKAIKASIFIATATVEDPDTSELNLSTQGRSQLRQNLEQQMRNFTTSLPHLPQPDQQRMLLIIERMGKVLAHLREGDAS